MLIPTHYIENPANMLSIFSKISIARNIGTKVFTKIKRNNILIFYYVFLLIFSTKFSTVKFRNMLGLFPSVKKEISWEYNITNIKISQKTLRRARAIVNDTRE